MHKKFVINIISRIVLFVSLVMSFPLAWAVYDNPYSKEVKAFAVTILLGILLSGAFLVGFKINKKDYTKINARDGLSIVGLTWICLSALGALPLYWSGVVSCYTDAFFEITSGFTTTGATIFPDVESLPRGILFWRSFTHWLGGMGIIALYIALLPLIGGNTFQLYKAEAAGITEEKIEPRIKETAKILWSVYSLFTVFCVILLIFGGMNFFDALCHAFGAVSTGGFSTKNWSIGAYNAYIQWVIILFMFLGGVNFVLYYQGFKGNWRGFRVNEEFRLFFLIVFISTILFTAFLMKSSVSQSPFRDAVFQIVSILTATGYVTADFDIWPQALRMMLLLMMFIGGCVGSTSGGFKVIRMLLVCKIGWRSIVQELFPNAILPVRYNRAGISDRTVLTVLAYFVIFVFLFFAGGLILMFTDSCGLTTALSASIATLSNVGPGLEKVGATQNYLWISIPGKWALIFLMLVGRLELYSILILFLPLTWRK